MKSILLLLLIMVQSASFKEAQLKNVRVKSAYQEKEVAVKEYFKENKLDYSGFQLFLRAFKKEELISILKKAGIENYSLRWKWAFRWQIIVYS